MWTPIKAINGILTKKSKEQLTKREWTIKCILCKSIIGFMENPVRDHYDKPAMYCFHCVVGE